MSDVSNVSKRKQRRLNGEVLDVDQVADFFGVSSTTVRRLFERGTIRAKKVGSQWRCLKTELDKFMCEP